MSSIRQLPFALVLYAAFAQMAATGVQEAHALSFVHTQKYSRIKSLEYEILLFAARTGALPDSAEADSLSYGWLAKSDVVYHDPARHGTTPFDLYWVGLNGVDDQGGLDDVTNWSGIPDIPIYDVDSLEWPPPLPQDPFSLFVFQSLIPNGSHIVMDLVVLAGLFFIFKLAVSALAKLARRRKRG